MPLPSGARAWVTRDGDAQYLPARGIVLPLRIEARLEHRGLLVTAQIEVERGRPVVKSVLVEGRGQGDGLQTRDLREVPLRALVAHAIETVAMPARLVNGRLVIEAFGSPEDTSAHQANPTKRRPRVDRDTLMRVAERYRAALAAGDPKPRVTVGAAMGMSSGQVRTLLRRARDMGVLGKAEWGRAGELTEEEEDEK